MVSRLQVIPSVVSLPDAAAAAPVAAADAVVIVPAVPAVPVVPVVLTNPDGPQVSVSAQSNFQVVSMGLIVLFFSPSEVPIKTFWKKHIVISLFLLEKHLLVSSAVMS